MNRKTVLIIGILTTIVIFGAVVGFAQNSSEKKKETENHECTPEMMEDMAKNCPEQMMKSGDGKNMMDGEKGHRGMMNGSTASNNTEGGEHCGDSSDMGSMMSGSLADKKGMM
ncbi:MAG: hypothetical protein WA144_05550 [Candidatus Methanoperedens sp.]